MEEALIQQYAAMADTVQPADESSFIKPKLTLSTPHTIVNNDEKSLVTKKLPFSINYVEMSKYKPIYNTQSDVFTTETNVMQQLDGFRQTGMYVPSQLILGGIYFIILNSFLTERSDFTKERNMVKVLKLWRKDQISKLQEELQRLHSIETFLGNIDTDNFKPYLDSQQLSILTSKKSKNIDDNFLCSSPSATSSKKTKL